MSRIFALRWILLFSYSLELHGVHAARCRFPSGWKGRYFQSRLGSVLIRDGYITTKGSCVEQQRDYFLFANRDNRCFQCLLMIQRHTNVIQYKESYCLPQDRLKTICSQIRIETPLFNLVRDPAVAVPCPFKDSYYFDYSDQLSGMCGQSISYSKPCAGSVKYRFHFKHCSPLASLNGIDPYLNGALYLVRYLPRIHVVHRAGSLTFSVSKEATLRQYIVDMSMECLATWKEGSESYLYSRVTGSGFSSKDDQYRCLNYQHFGSEVYVSMSGDATCRGLRTARDGQFTLELTQDVRFDAFGSRPKAGCRYPDWLIKGNRTWSELDGKRFYRVIEEDQRSLLHRFTKKKSREMLEIEHLCVEILNFRESTAARGAAGDNKKSVTLKTHSIEDCDSKIKCLRIQRLSASAVYLQEGTFADEQCQFTTAGVVLIGEQQGADVALRDPCPVSGFFHTIDDDDCSKRVTINCMTLPENDPATSVSAIYETRSAENFRIRNERQSPGNSTQRSEKLQNFDEFENSELYDKITGTKINNANSNSSRLGSIKGPNNGSKNRGSNTMKSDKSNVPMIETQSKCEPDVQKLECITSWQEGANVVIVVRTNSSTSRTASCMIVTRSPNGQEVTQLYKSCSRESQSVDKSFLGLSFVKTGDCKETSTNQRSIISPDGVFHSNITQKLNRENNNSDSSKFHISPNSKNISESRQQSNTLFRYNNDYNKLDDYDDDDDNDDYADYLSANHYVSTMTSLTTSYPVFQYSTDDDVDDDVGSSYNVIPIGGVIKTENERFVVSPLNKQSESDPGKSSIKFGYSAINNLNNFNKVSNKDPFSNSEKGYFDDDLFEDEDEDDRVDFKIGSHLAKGSLDDIHTRKHPPDKTIYVEGIRSHAKPRQDSSWAERNSASASCRHFCYFFLPHFMFIVCVMFSLLNIRFVPRL